MGYQIKTKRNPSLDEGVWAEYQGSKFKIAHTSNSHFMRKMASLQAPFRRDIEKGRMDPDESKRIVAEALSTCILKDWNITDANGNSVPYSQKIGQQALMADDALREFVQEYALDFANYREEEIEAKGND